MNKEQFETRIKELLPQTTEQALMRGQNIFNRWKKRKLTRQAICLTMSMWNYL